MTSNGTDATPCDDRSPPGGGLNEQEAELAAQERPPVQSPRKGVVATAVKVVVWGVVFIGLACAAVACPFVLLGCDGGQDGYGKDVIREWEEEKAKRKQEREEAAAMTMSATAAPAA